MPIRVRPDGFYATPFERRPDVRELTELGRALFAERALSASGRMACATCHDPKHAYGPPNDHAVQFGGVSLREPGLRAVPSLRYLQTVPPFSEHFSDSDGDDGIDQGPAGGRGWDGSTSSAHDQATVPLLSRFEMANASPEAVVGRLRESANAVRFRQAFGEHVLDHPQLAWNGLLWALEVFQQSPADFQPYSSRYDAVLRHQATLSPAEQRGLALFNDPRKGNCAQCHPSGIRRGAFPLFTDHGLIALGVPRNPAIPANRDPSFHDLGACGPLRSDVTGKPELCGIFKTPSLRNAATRPVFFHNGVLRRLDEVVRFYAERDAYPQHYYRRDARGRVQARDDLPPAYRDNLNREPPFDGQRPGHPSLTAAEVDDIVAFIGTLTDADATGPDARASTTPPRH